MNCDESFGGSFIQVITSELHPVVPQITSTAV